MVLVKTLNLPTRAMLALHVCGGVYAVQFFVTLIIIYIELAQWVGIFLRDNPR